jgi:electron transfer flavoprotein beta subunit
MKILVGVKRVVDYAVKVRVGQNGVDLKNVKMSLNPFCEIAVEEAVRMKEANKQAEVVALSIGGPQCKDTIKTALAMGCDRGIHIHTNRRGDYMELQSDAVAKLFQKVIETKENDTNLVIVGKQSIDSDCGQVGPMLAGYMNWPQATFAAKVDFDGDDGLLVERETDQGTETIKVSKLPAVVTCDLRLNTPRYATLPNIMKAKKKKIDTFEADEFGIDLEPRNEVLEVFEPPPRKEGILVEDVDGLIDKLKNEASVIQ